MSRHTSLRGTWEAGAGFNLGSWSYWGQAGDKQVQGCDDFGRSERGACKCDAWWFPVMGHGWVVYSHTRDRGPHEVVSH